ncbi:MAG TPA: carboxypeptidase-like regulatory domain-containing protein [Vicinamibacterales bacterium]|nr:carboxypeptidase-like regulatory domain-containing protein [Vicinamibacterales bacterium]
MRSAAIRRMLVLMMCVAASSTWAIAQQTGLLSGVVRDSQGGVLPGVTVSVSSPALMGLRTATTTETGNYQFTGLPPGTYEVKYELSGFSTLRRDDIRVLVAQTTRLDIELAVGSLQETVTVSGESPVVDVSSTTTQTNISKDLYEAIPTGRNPWVMAGLVPGVVTGRLDVGGTEGMQQYNLEAFGSADSQKSFSIDGLKTNWGGGGGGSTMQYYGFEMYEEYNMQTASGTAESDVSGVYMNMVTKSGGNRVTSDHNFYFMNDALQGTNIDDALRTRLGLRPGQPSGAAGNPIDISYDWSSTIGGPIKKDKGWFFGAVRSWKLNQFQIGALNPDGSQAIDDNRIDNYMGKATWQTSATTKASFMFNRNLKYRFHRREVDFSEDKATVLQDQPAQNYVAQVNHVLGRRTVIDARFGRMWGVFPTRYQKEVQPTDIAIRDIVQNTQINAATEQSLNPNHRYQANATVSYFADNFGAGTHDVKAGTQLSWEKMQYNRIRNGDLYLELNDGVPLRAQIANTPVDSDHRLRTWSAFVQDRWVIGRATINYGARIDGLKAFLPAQSSPAGTFVAARSFAETDVYQFGLDVAPRIGISYDLFGRGRTALKAYYGRFYNQFGSEIAESVNPNARISLQVPWIDRNSNLRLDPGELNLANFTGFSGVFPRMDQNAARPYSDEMNIGVDHQLLRDFAVSVSYHRRQHRDGLAIVDQARPEGAYTAVTRTYTDPQRGAQAITVYSLDPTLVTRRDRVITNVDVLESDYNGVQFSFNKRMSNRWQMLAGVTLQKHEGFNHSGTYTNPGTNTDLNNPNYRLNRAGSAIFTDIPWSFNLSGSYQLPYDIVFSGKYTARDGSPLMRTINIAGLPQGSETIWVQPRGVDRTEVVDKFLDVRVMKRIAVGRTRLEGSLDVFNLLNANDVLDQTDAIGTTLGRPSRVLAPRIFRFGATVRF